MDPVDRALDESAPTTPTGGRASGSTTAGGEIAAIIADGQAAGDFAAADPERAALELASLIDGLAVQVALGDRRRLAGADARAPAPRSPSGCSSVELPAAAEASGVSSSSRAASCCRPAPGVALGRLRARRLHGRAPDRPLGRGADHQAEDRRRPADLQLGPVHGPGAEEGVRREVRGRGQRGQLRQPRGDGDQAAQRRQLRPDLPDAPSTSYRLAGGPAAPLRPRAAAQLRRHLDLLRQPLVRPQQRALGSLHLLHDRDRLARRTRSPA